MSSRPSSTSSKPPSPSLSEASTIILSENQKTEHDPPNNSEKIETSRSSQADPPASETATAASPTGIKREWRVDEIPDNDDSDDSDFDPKGGDKEPGEEYEEGYESEGKTGSGDEGNGGEEGEGK
jgi:hypothetical protein